MTQSEPFPGHAELSAVSARIGADPLLIQGPGGNTSVKQGDALWVKGSGVWLAQALDRPIFAGVSLASARSEAVMQGAQPTPLEGADPALRPSIETPLHALMPHAAVVHAHAVNSMTLSVLADGAARAASALDGLDWAWIAYAQPGLPLALAVKAALEKAAVDILILQNHGVVVGADSPLAAEALLREVERRLAFPEQTAAASPLLSNVGAIGDYAFLPALAPLAAEARLFALVTRAPLFPDQVVFLGGAVPKAGSVSAVPQAAAEIAARTGVAPALVLVPGVGAFGRIGRSRAADAVITGLYEVARRVPPDAAVTGLAETDAAALLGMEQEAYRIRLAEAQGR